MTKKPVHLTGIAFDAKSSFMRGAAKGPDAIRQVLHDGSSNYWTEKGIDLKAAINLIDQGNISSDDYHQLEHLIGDLYDESKSHVFLGGDHSVTYSIIKAISKKRTDFDILHFDAHTDLYDEFEGDKYSHACPFARIMEGGLCKRLIQVGIRTITDHQQAQADRWQVEIIRMNEIEKINKLQFERPVYISLDLDVFDPAYAPGVSHHEPGGLDPRTAINFLLNTDMNLFAADIVELNPVRDLNGMTAALAAKFVKELCGMFS